MFVELFGFSPRQEWDRANGIHEQQLISISDALSGTFRLSLDGAATVPIPHNAPASRIASALSALPNVASPLEISKEGDASMVGSSTWRVTFMSNIGDLPTMGIQVLIIFILRLSSHTGTVRFIEILPIMIVSS